MDRESIFNHVKEQLEHGRYSGSDVYGDGNASGKILKILSNGALPKDVKKVFYDL